MNNIKRFIISISMEPWRLKPVQLDNGRCRMYVISAKDAHDTIGRENSEFNQIAGQFSKLCSVDIKHVKEVHRIEYSESSSVLGRYNGKRLEFQSADKDDKEIFVFHGTSEENFKKIASEGFKIGGQDVKVMNGSAYGSGVYTAVAPTTPIQYSRGLAKVIIARGLLGNVSKEILGKCDTLSIGSDWRIFKSVDQLLPVGFVVFTETAIPFPALAPANSRMVNMAGLLGVMAPPYGAMTQTTALPRTYRPPQRTHRRPLVASPAPLPSLALTAPTTALPPHPLPDLDEQDLQVALKQSEISAASEAERVKRIREEEDEELLQVLQLSKASGACPFSASSSSTAGKMYDDDDSDFKRAIELSLIDGKRRKAESSFSAQVVLCSLAETTREEEEIKIALQQSLLTAASSSERARPQKDELLLVIDLTTFTDESQGDDSGVKGEDEYTPSTLGDISSSMTAHAKLAIKRGSSYG